MRQYRKNAIRFLALVEIYNRGRDEDEKIKTVNPAESKVLSTIENLSQRVADQVKIYEAEIDAGWWRIDDITREGMLENLFDDEASSPWCCSSTSGAGASTQRIFRPCLFVP